MKLHLGCNDVEMPGYVGVDVVAPAWATPENFQQVDLSGRHFSTFESNGFPTQSYVEMFDPKRWPWEDSSVEEIVAHDVLEHVDNLQFPGSKGIIWCLNEAHRVLKPGGILDLKVPCIDFRPDGVMIGGMGVFCDPTHVQRWTKDTRYYFDERWADPKTGERGRLGPGMGITAMFRTLPDCESGVDWQPVIYNARYPERRKLILKLQAVK